MENQTVNLEGRVTSLEIRMAVNEADVRGVKEDVSSIKDDTKWLRRTITNALIGGSITLIGGIVLAVILFFARGGSIG